MTQLILFSADNIFDVTLMMYVCFWFVAQNELDCFYFESVV